MRRPKATLSNTRHVAEQRVVLEHEAHVALTHMHVGGVFAAEQDVAVVGCFQPGDDAQQRGLAAARGAEQGDQFAGLECPGSRRCRRLEGAEVLLTLRIAMLMVIHSKGQALMPAVARGQSQRPSGRARTATPQRT